MNIFVLLIVISILIPVTLLALALKLNSDVLGVTFLVSLLFALIALILLPISWYGTAKCNNFGERIGYETRYQFNSEDCQIYIDGYWYDKEDVRILTDRKPVSNPVIDLRTDR